MFAVNGYKIFQNSKTVESYDVDPGKLTDLVSIVEAPLKIKAYSHSDSGKIDVIVDGTDFHFFLITGDIVFDKVNRRISFTNLKREQYVKSNILFRAKYRVTQDFIICTSYSSPLRRYLPDDNTRLATFMVWAKREGQYKGNGYSYRL